MLKKILIVLIVLIAAFGAVVAMQPADFRIERSQRIAAAPEKIFPYLNNLKRGNEWSPFMKMEPNAKSTFEGPEAGVGAITRWEGDKIGAGSMTIVESKPNELVRSRLDFLKPMQATNTADYTLRREGNETVVTWSMYGQNNFIGKAFNLVMNCDKMVGSEFENGLNNLKTIVEKK
ncbi:MAG: SRPBCC family protein [Pseudomonadota bacterium]